MVKLGITGGMGSGKSTAAHFFRCKGAKVFDADEEAKRHLLSHIDLQNRIIDIFGNQVTRDGCLDLPKLSEYTFSSKQNQDTLNKIIWPEVSTLIKFTAKKAALDDIDLFVFHQASKLVLENIIRTMSLDKDKVFINLKYVGNTVSASIPIALKDAENQGQLKDGDRVMLVGFGVGLSWGATLVTWDKK